MKKNGVFGPYEFPLLNLGQIVIHIPTGKRCEVRGFLGWEVPIIQYHLLEIGGDFLDNCATLHDIATIS